MSISMQDERHSFLVRGQAKPHILYVDGCDPINSVLESLAVSSTTVEADEGFVHFRCSTSFVRTQD